MKSRTAEEWGRAHGSCSQAMEWRKSLGHVSQRTAWRRCHRGDWMFWQLRHGLTAEQSAVVMPPLLRAIDAIVERAIRAHAAKHEKARSALLTDRAVWRERAQARGRLLRRRGVTCDV